MTAKIEMGTAYGKCSKLARRLYRRASTTLLLFPFGAPEPSLLFGEVGKAQETRLMVSVDRGGNYSFLVCVAVVF